jgi:hypothetical protein
MHGLHALRSAPSRRLRDERGWALVDALASTVVVVLAFVGTTMAFNGSTASVTRDQKKTQAMVVAQNQINELRGVGQRDIDQLLALDNTTKTVNYRGTPYTVDYRAYYVTGLGSDQQDACQNSYTSGSGTARYIYMRVAVTYPGQTSGASGTGNPYLTAPASLDSYYSPEGGGVQTDTGTLRVYVLDRNNNVAGGVSSVNLYIAGTSTPIAPRTSNTTTGCYLFTGLERNSYEVRASVSGKQDIYMSNTGSSPAYVKLPVVMPDRGALSREIRIDMPVTVVPKYYTNTGTIASPVKTPVTSGGNPYFGRWIAASDQIRAVPSSDYSYIPNGISFMPHANTPTAGTLPNAMFPSAQGYSAYAGPCDANDPNAGVDEFTNNQAQLPATLPDSNWVPGGNYTALELWLTQLRSSIQLTSNPTPSTPYVSGRYYYYNQAFNGSATVKVRLVADQDGGTTTARCKPSTTLFNTWQTLGTLSSSGATLSDAAEALPAGTYDVCVAWPWTQTARKASSTTSLATYTSPTPPSSGTAYFSAPGIQILYGTPLTLQFRAQGPASPSTNGTDSPVQVNYANGTTNCAP